MATGRVRVEKDYIDLDLHLEIKIHPQPKKDVLKSANSILRNIMQLEYRRIEDHLNKRCGKELLSIIHVRLDEQWNGTIKTVIKSRQALHELFLLCKRPLDKKSNNEFTELLTEFFPKYPLNEKCVFPPQTNITFNVDIPGKRFEKAKKFFKEKARKIKESEALSKMDGSIRTCYSTETDDIDEGSALPANGENKQWLMHKFIVASPKGNAISKICVKSAEITQLNDALKQYNDCPEMFYIDAVLPTDASGYYEYQFITKTFFRSTTTKRTFRLLNKLIHRDIHEPKTCILSHLRHIICSTEETNLVNACIEIENLCKYGNDIAMDAIPELLQCQNKLSDIGNLKLVITISFIKKSSLEFLNTIITPSQAKLFIAPLLKTSLQRLPCSCAEYMPFSCFQMSMMAHGNDLSICRFLFDFYHFFDDNAMIDTITLLASKHCKIALEDDLDIIVDLFQKLNVPESSAIAILQKQVFTTVDLLMGINIYKKLLKKRIFECGEDNMSNVHRVLQARFQEKFSWAQNRYSLHYALVYAEILTESNANAELNLNTDIEQSFLKILTNKTLVTNNEQMKLKDCILNKSLFVNERTQLQLLVKLSSSKSIQVRCIFIELATETKFKTAYANLPVKDFQRYIECEMADCGRTAKKVKVNGNIEAFINVLKMPCMQSEPTRLDKLVEENRMLLQKSTLDDVLGTVTIFENRCTDDHLFELYKRQIQTELEQRRHEPVKLLRMLFGNASRIYVKTRVSAKLVCFVLEKMFGEISCDRKVFIAVKSHVQFWTQLRECKGEQSKQIKEHAVYTQVMGRLSYIVDLISTEEIQVKFLNEMQLERSETQRAMQLGGMNSRSLQDLPMKIKSVLDQTDKTLNNVKTVISYLKPHLDIGNEETVYKGLLKIAAEIDVKQESLSSGDLPVRCCTLAECFIEEYRNLPDSCVKLYPALGSKLFLHVLKVKLLSDKYIAIFYHQHAEYFGLLSTRFIYQNQTEQDEDLYDKSIALAFIHYIADKGMELFKSLWHRLENESTHVNYDFLAKTFLITDISKEINIIEVILNRSILGNIRMSLTCLREMDQIENNVNAFVSVFKTFNCDFSGGEMRESLDWISKFRSRDDSYQESFQTIRKHLETLQILTVDVSEETLEVIRQLGQATAFLAFLKEIDIDDVRNLIDAVEDISELDVQESTVSALIEVKRFLHPLFLSASKKMECKTFLDNVQKQVLSLGSNAKIAVKICTCKSHVHNLRSLYKNFANRGEQTKEVIKCVITKGEFEFSLAPDRTKIFFCVIYKENQKRRIKNESTVLDIKSRAHLLLNSERQSSDSKINQEEFRRFIKAIDTGIEIRDTIYELHTSGHIRYRKIHEKIQSKELEKEKDTLCKELKQWNNRLIAARNDSYLLNFVQGYQIHVLHQYLKDNEAEEQVEVLLKFIHPQLSANQIKEAYQGREQKTKTMKDIGNAIHSVFRSKRLRLHYSELHLKGLVKKIDEVVHDGRILLAKLDIESPLVIHTLLALYVNTTGHFPEPNQVLLCTNETSWNEIYLLLERSTRVFDFNNTLPLYCLANIEKLHSNMLLQLVDALFSLKDSTNFKLAIIYRGSENHFFIDQLHDNVAIIQPVSDLAMENLFRGKCPNVLTFTSAVAGLGKTTKISQYAHSLRCSKKTLQISGNVSRHKMIERLSNLKLKSYHVLHLDIGAISNPAELDTFLFELIVLRFVSSEKQAFYVPTENVCIEIANTINNTLCDSLPMATAFYRRHIEWNEFDNFTVSKEVNSPTQVVCRYLDLLEEQNIDTIDVQLVDDATIVSENRCRYLLRTVFANSADISYSMVHVFLSFLADQLKRMSESPFLRVRHIPEMVDNKETPSIRSTFVQSMTEVAIEFATRSVRSCRSAQIRTLGSDETSDSSDNILQLVNRVDGMIHWEDSNHIMFVFHNQDIHTLSLLYRDIKQVPAIIHNLFETQMRRKLEDYNGLPQEQLQEILQRVARCKPGLLPSDRLNDISKDYALTPDNLLKMVLIMLRITSHIPVVIMGETGCGKTSLIRYLAEIAGVHLSIMNVHAGVDSLDVVATVFKENDQCLKECSSQRWIFFDEFNTSECIGTICDILCHHVCDGKLLAPNFVPIGACNPYKLRSTQEILTAGLDYKATTDNLSKLVYRVLPLPESAIDFVWDFGSLTVEDEKKYIMRMVSDVFKDKSDDITHLFCDVLVESQLFVRKSQHNAYSVSLREVFRCKRLVIWFMGILKRKTTTVKRTKLMTVSSTAIIMSLTHVYHSRFEKKKIRKEYRNMISTVFSRHGRKCDESVIHRVIKSEQMDILNSMILPRGTAKNTALRENIFVILVCILNKIPVFVVGKPGCSKSLAMQVIRSNLRGKDSEDEFFKTLPQLFCVSFQGSESSTSEGIEKVFEKAEKYQKSNNIEDVLSVVILDEIGLAEISKFNPLKVLHSLLEPEPRSFPDIAVVGISNWALDASKMNRAIHLSRPDMDEEELFDTAVSISESFFEESSRKHGLKGDYKSTTHDVDTIKNGLKQVAKCYFRYTKEGQFVNFHGLRDFYALVKFIAKALTSNSSDEDANEPFKHAVIEGLQRNFGGICRQELDVVSYFRECFDGSLQQFKHVQSLIEANVEDQLARHLMIITRGDSALNIVEQTLKETKKCKKEVIFGSQFVEDLTDDYHYRILSRIILCMEQGYVLILKDLENIYGSLYDMLNQNYSRIGNRNICRIALGPYSNPFCHVAEEFRCIVLVNENRIDFKDPPFLNRFEKQFVSYSDILQTDEEVLVRDVNKWINNVSRIQDRHFEKGDVFPYFNYEMVVSLVIWSARNMAASQKNALELCKHELLQIMKPDAVLRLQHAEDYEVRSSANILLDLFFELPLHHGLVHYIHHDVLNNSDIDACGNLTIVFTNSAIHTNISNDLKNCQSETLASFKSEKQLSLNLQRFWESSQTEVLLVTCNASEDEKHLMLTKSLIEKFKAEKYDHNQITKRVYLVIHMRGWNALYGSTTTQCSPVTQINFLSGWKLVLIDTLEKPNICLPDLYLQSLSDVVENMTLTELLKRELFWAFTRIKYGSHGRDIKSITELLSQLEQSEEFLTAIGHRILMYIKDNETGQDTDWCSYVANDVHLLHTSSFFVDALEKFIITVIKEPFAKILFKLETCGALESFFVQDCFTSMRRSFWKSIFFDERIIDIASVKPESGPECYMCNTTNIFLKSPFSRIIFETAEATKDEFLDEVSKVKITCELESDLDLPDSVLNELLLQHECSILSKLPDLSKYFISHKIYLLDYLTDYCSLTIDTIFFSEIHNQMSRSNRIECICWCLEQKMEIDMVDYISYFTRLHGAGWINHKLFRYLLQLLDICKFALDKEDALIIFQQDINNRDYTDNKPSPIDGFISFICSSLFPTEKNIQRHSGIDKWLTVVSKVLTVASEISVEMESYHALRFSVDMVTDLIIDSEINANVLFKLGDQLEIFSIESSEVYEAFHDMITKILAAPLTDRVQEAIQRSMCQYLVRCLSTHPDTIAYENFFELLKCFPVLSKCVNFSKLPIKYLLGRATENVLYQLIHNDTEEELTDAFLCSLNECLGDVLQDNSPHREFTLLVIDLMENLYKEGDLSLHDMLACGRIVQERQVSGIRMVAAIAYVRASVEDFSKIILAPKQSDCNEILDLIDALLHGWEGSYTQKGVMLFFLKHLAENRHFHDLSKLCNQFTSRIQELKKIKWTDKYISCGFEQNPLVFFFSKDVLQKCEAANDVFNRKQQEYSATLKIVQTTSSSCLLPFHISLKEFYFPRTYRQLTETEKRKADKLGGVFSTCLDPIQRKALQYIVGKNDFISSIFTPHTELSFEEYMINNVLISSFSLSISTCSNIEGDKLPFLPLCLLKPALLKERYIPGVPDPIQTIRSFRSGILPCNELYMCKCGKTLMCRKSGNIVCIACKRPCLDPPVTRYERSDATDQQSHSQKGLELIQLPESLTSVRGLSPVSTAILQFLITGNLLGSVAFEYSEWSALEDVVTGVSAINMKRFLEKHVFDSWRFLKIVLNLNDNLLGIFISSVLYECNVYAYEQQNGFSTPDSRTVWENKFNEVVIQMLPKKLRICSARVWKCDNIYEFPTGCIEQMIREVSDPLGNTCKPSELYFRMSSYPSKDNFCYQLWEHRAEHPLLAIVVGNEKTLRAIQHIYTIIQWHMTTVYNASYIITRNECETCTVAGYHSKQTNPSQRVKSQQKFSLFKKCMNELIDFFGESFSNTDKVTSNSKLSQCLLLETGNDIYEMLMTLINLQNSFLEKALALSETCPQLQFLQGNKNMSYVDSVPIAEVKMMHLIEIKTEIEEFFQDESHCGLQYGEGREIKYDFYSIEKTIAKDLLVGKAYINLSELPSILFIDDLYENFVSLVNEIRRNIPQSIVPDDMAKSLREKSLGNPSLATELLHFIDMVFTLLKKTQCDPKKSLSEFAEERKIIIGQPFPVQLLPHPENRIKVSHVVSLHETLEEICYESIRDSLSDIYIIDLGPRLRDHLKSILTMKKADVILKALKIFVYRCLFMMGVSSDQELCYYLCKESFWPKDTVQNGILCVDAKKEPVKDIFISDMQVCHAVKVIEEISSFVEKQKRVDVRLDKVITDWKSSSGRQTHQKMALTKIKRR